MLPIEATPQRPDWRNWKWPDAAGSGRRAESCAGHHYALDCGRCRALVADWRDIDWT